MSKNLHLYGPRVVHCTRLNAATTACPLIHAPAQSYFTRMKEAVQKEYFLLALTKPQPPTRYLFDATAQANLLRRTGLTRVTAGITNLWAAAAAAEGRSGGGGGGLGQDCADGANGGQLRGSVWTAGDEGVVRGGTAAAGGGIPHHHGRSQSASTAKSKGMGGDGSDAPGRGGAAGQGAAARGNAGAGAAARDDESAPLLASNGLTSSAAPCARGMADSPFASASGVAPPLGGSCGGAASPTGFGRASDATSIAGGGTAAALHAAGSAAAVTSSGQRQLLSRTLSGILQRLKESYKRAMLLHRHGVRGDIVTVVGRNGPTPMLPSEAARASAAAASPAVIASAAQVPVWEECEHGQSWWDGSADAGDGSSDMHRRPGHTGGGGGRPPGPAWGSNDDGGGANWTARAGGPYGGAQHPDGAQGVSGTGNAGAGGGRGAAAGGKPHSLGHKRRDEREKKRALRDMETSLYWLEQHIRQNKLRYTTLTDQLGAAAESPELRSEVSNKRDARRLAFYLYWNLMGHNMQRPFVVPRDLEGFFDNAEEVKACFQILDTDGDGEGGQGHLLRLVGGKLPCMAW